MFFLGVQDNYLTISIGPKPKTISQKHRGYSERTRWDDSCDSPLGLLLLAHDIFFDFYLKFPSSYPL